MTSAFDSPLILEVPKATITSKGFAGTIAANAPTPTYNQATNTFTGPLSGNIAGIAIGLQSLSIAIHNNAILASTSKAQLHLPFFNETLDIDLALAQGGGWHINLALPNNKPISIIKDLGSFGIHLDLTSLQLEAGGEGPGSIALGGHGKLLLFDEWTDAFPLVAFKIGADGSIGLPSGWLPLNKPIARKLGPCQITIARIGLFPMPDGRKDIVLDAAVNFGAGTQAGVAAKGLRISFPADWNGAPQVSFEGIGVAIERPGFSLKGEVSMRNDANGLSFAGAAKATISAIDANVEAALRFGVDSSSGTPVPYTAVYLDLNLSKGIDLFGSGLAIYGMQGLLALNYAPDREDNQPWYSIDGNDWFHAAPETGVRNLAKWKPQAGAFALGVGVTLGTTPRPKAFNGKFLLLFTLPGPVIFLEGRANMLRGLADLDKDTMFKALVAFDANVGTLQFGLDAKYRYPSKGELVDAAGGAEAFFDFHDASRFYLKLGLEAPESARIQATLISFFKANAFLLLDARRVRFGAKTGFKIGGKYGPIELGASLWFAALVDLSWSPPQLQALVSIEGHAVAKAFGYGLSLNLAAAASVDAQRPFLVKGKASISAKVPFYGTAKASVALEWSAAKGQPKPKAGALLSAPELVLPLVAASLQHPKLPTAWAMQLGTTLLPAGLADAAGLLLPASALPKLTTDIGPADGGPIVPLDAVIDLRFAVSMDDNAKVAVNSAGSLPETIVGNASLGTDKATARARYALLELELSAWDVANKAWNVLAKVDGKDDGKDDGKVDGKVDPRCGLYGVWRPAPGPKADGAPTGAQTLLRLWGIDPLALLDSPSGEAAKTALDAGDLLNPFVTAGIVTSTYGFAPWPLGALQGDEVVWPGGTGPKLTLDGGAQASIVCVDDDGALTQALRVQGPPTATGGTLPEDPRKRHLLSSTSNPWTAPWQPPSQTEAAFVVCVELGAAARRVELRSKSQTSLSIAGHAPNCPWSQPIDLAAPGGSVSLELDGVQSLTLTAEGPFELLWLRIERTADSSKPLPGAALAAAPALAAHAHLFGAPGHLLPAGARLRLRLTTRASQQVRPGIVATEPVLIEQALYFRTEGGPGLANLSLPGAGGDDAPALRDTDGALVDVRGVATTGAPTLAGPANDLSPYLAAALPPLASDRAGPRHFRAIDLGADFAPAGTRDLYRSQRRDLALRLRSSGGEPLRGRDGLPSPLLPRWLPSTALPNTPEQLQLLADWQQATGVAVADTALLQSARLRLPTNGSLPVNAGLQLEAVPLLLAEGPDAAGSAPAGWYAHGVPGTAAAPWTAVKLTDACWLHPPTLAPQAAPDTTPIAWSRLRWAGIPGALDVAWRDVDAHLTLRCTPTPTANPGACGVLLATGAAATSGLCLWLDPRAGDLRLLWLQDATITTWAAADLGPALGRALQLRLRLQNGAVHVAVDGAIACVAERPQLQAAIGTLALFATGAVDPAFRDLRVEDLRPTASPEAAKDAGAVSLTRPVWARALRTGAFVDLRHLAASAPHKAESIDAGPTHSDAVADLSLAGAVALPTLTPTIPSANEARAAEALLVALEPHLQLLRAPRDGMQLADLGAVDGRRAFLVRCEQALDWSRTTLRLRAGPAWTLPPRLAGAVEIAGPFVDDAGHLAAIDLMVRRPLRATESLQPAFRAVLDPAIALGTRGPNVAFTASAAAGELYREAFVPWAFDLWRPTGQPPPGASWALQGKAIAAVGAPNAGFGLLSPAIAASDVHVSATLEATKGTIGVVFRHQSGEGAPFTAVNWRPAAQGGASLEATQRYRGNDGKLHTIPHALSAPPAPLGTLRLDVIAVGPTVVVFGNGRLCGGWQDLNPQPGACGLAAAELGDGKASTFAVYGAGAPPIRQRWSNLVVGAGHVVDAAAVSAGPSAWTVAVEPKAPSVPDFAGFGDAAPGDATKISAVMRQDSAIASAPTGAAATPPASVWLLPSSEVLAGRAAELLLHVQLRPAAAGRCGVVVGWNGPGDAIAVMLDAAKGILRIDRYVGGAHETCSAAEITISASAWHTLLLRLSAGRVSAFVDGKPATSLAIPGPALGRVGLCTDSAKGAAFATPALFDLTATAGPWQVHTPCTAVPSTALASDCAWRWRDGWLYHQPLAATANAHQLALAGEANWQTLTMHATLRRSTGACGVVLSWRDQGQGALRLRIDDQASVIERREQGSWAALAGQGPGWQALGPQVQLQATRTTAGVRVDFGQGAILAVKATDAAGGQVGCWADAGALCSFGALALRPATLTERALFATGAGAPVALGAWTAAIVPSVAAKPASWGLMQGPAAWEVHDGAIVQLSDAWAGAKAAHATAEVSAEAFDAGPALWCPATLPPRCTLTLRVRSPQGGGVGLLLDQEPTRQGQPRLLRWDMDQARGFARVTRVDGDDIAVCWRTDASLAPARWMRWTLVLQPDRVAVWVDGVPQCAIAIDGPIWRVGLTTYANAGASFADLRVLDDDNAPQHALVADDLAWDAGTLALPDGGAWVFAQGALQGKTGPAHGASALAGGVSAADVRVCATILLHAGAAGLLLRVGSDALLRVEFDANDWRLVLATAAPGSDPAKTAWTEQIVATGPMPTGLPDQARLLCVDAIGPRVELWLDGVALGSAEVDLVGAGSVGLALAVAAAAQFSDLQVHQAL